jgi:hypothetical protein
MASQAQFQAFVRLVRKMHEVQQECYRESNSNGNKIAQAKSLEQKVSAKLREFPAGQYQPFYDWQLRFVQLVAEVREEQGMYYATKYETVLNRCREKEATLAKSLQWIAVKHPEFFADQSKQTSLFP